MKAYLAIPRGYRLVKDPLPTDFAFIQDLLSQGAHVGDWVPYGECADGIDANAFIRPTKTTLKKARKAART